MALDGAFLRHVKREIESVAIGARVDKIYQPSREEFIFSLRSKVGTYKLLFCTRANSARVHFTKVIPENPAVPPMLCMLFRKKLLGSKLLKIRQPALERSLLFDFEAINELGDKVILSLVVEVMGKYSNIILIDANGKIIDALKRVDIATSSKRQILPGIQYEVPPSQEKLDLLEADIDEIIKDLESKLKSDEDTLSECILSVISGLSPVVCREIEYVINRNANSSLKIILTEIKSIIKDCSGKPFMVYENNRPKDFSFLQLSQYDTVLLTKEFSSFSDLLDAFFFERDRIDRLKVKARDLFKHLSSILTKLKKKIKIQKNEILQSENKDDLKLFADLINANLYKLDKGMSEVELENFYDEKLGMVKIRLDPLLTPVQNAQKFYKQYRKAKTTKANLKIQIEKATEEIKYIESVLDALSRAESEADILEINEELIAQGYLKPKKRVIKKNQALPPIQYHLNDKVKVLVGRNNYQNDKLTLKSASKQNLWFHVKDMPGSHIILIADEADIDDNILICTAQIAAYHSKAKNSSNVPVDYTTVKNVKKPQGAKPGKVIYYNYKTLFVTPDKNFNVKKPQGAKPGKVIYYNYKTLFVTPDKNFIDNLR